MERTTTRRTLVTAATGMGLTIPFGPQALVQAPSMAWRALGYPELGFSADFPGPPDQMSNTPSNPRATSSAITHTFVTVGDRWFWVSTHELSDAAKALSPAPAARGIIGDFALGKDAILGPSRIVSTPDGSALEVAYRDGAGPAARAWLTRVYIAGPRGY